MNEGRRIGLHFQQTDETRYYDIDPDGRVYWLRVSGLRRDKITRYRVEPALAERIREIAIVAQQQSAGGPSKTNPEAAGVSPADCHDGTTLPQIEPV